MAAPKSADVTPFWPPRSGCVRSSAPRFRWASGWALRWAWYCPFLERGRAAAGPKARSGCICGPGSHGQQDATAARWPKARDYESMTLCVSQSLQRGNAHTKAFRAAACPQLSPSVACAVILLVPVAVNVCLSARRSVGASRQKCARQRRAVCWKWALTLRRTRSARRTGGRRSDGIRTKTRATPRRRRCGSGRST